MYKCETWSLTLRDRKRLLVFENRALRMFLRPMFDPATGRPRLRSNRDIRNLTAQPLITTVIKSRRLQWAGHVVQSPVGGNYKAQDEINRCPLSVGLKLADYGLRSRSVEEFGGAGPCGASGSKSKMALITAVTQLELQVNAEKMASSPLSIFRAQPKAPKLETLRKAIEHSASLVLLANDIRNLSPPPGAFPKHRTTLFGHPVLFIFKDNEAARNICFTFSN